MRGLPAAVAVVAALAFAAASTGASPLRQPTGYKNYCEGMRGVKCVRGGVPSSLWRPLSLPSIGPDGACPADTPVKRFQSTNAVIGRGPAYLNAGNSGNTLTVYNPAPLRFQSTAPGWGVGVLKVALKPTFRGPYVLRGGRIDSPGLMGFSGPAGVRPYSALQIPPRAKTPPALDVVWSGGYVYVTEPGCYAVQMDGPSFSYAIVFRAIFHL
jgi:hypothetical protein